MGALLSVIVRQGLRKGLFGGSQPWLAAGIAAWGIQRFRTASGRRAEVVYRRELKPGESLVIDHTHVRHGDM